MKVQFRCKQSGNIVSFTNEQDIHWMRKEASYEEIKDEIKAESSVKQEIRKSIIDYPDENNNEENVSQNGDDGAKDSKMLKKRGRPRNIEQNVI